MEALDYLRNLEIVAGARSTFTITEHRMIAQSLIHSQSLMMLLNNDRIVLDRIDVNSNNFMVIVKIRESNVRHWYVYHRTGCTWNTHRCAFTWKEGRKMETNDIGM